MGRLERKLRFYRMIILFGFWSGPLNALLLLTGVSKMGTNSDGVPYPGWLGALLILFIGMPLFRWLLKLVESQLEELSIDDS